MGDSNTFSPRASFGRMCWMTMGFTTLNTLTAAVVSFVVFAVSTARSLLASCTCAPATINGIAMAAVRSFRVFIGSSGW